MPTYTAKQLQIMAENIACDIIASHSKCAPKFLHQCAREAKKMLDTTKAAHKGKPKVCVKHPAYKAIRRPINGCLGCLQYYNQVQF